MYLSYLIYHFLLYSITDVFNSGWSRVILVHFVNSECAWNQGRILDWSGTMCTLKSKLVSLVNLVLLVKYFANEIVLLFAIMYKLVFHTVKDCCIAKCSLHMFLT